MKIFALSLLLIFTFSTNGEQISLRWPGDVWEIDKGEFSLRFKSSRGSLEIPFSPCTRPYLENFWEDLKRRSAAPGINGQSRIRHLNIVMDGRERKTIFHPQKRFLSQVDRSFLALVAQTTSSCSQGLTAETNLKVVGKGGRKPAQNVSDTQRCVESVCKDPAMAYEALITGPALQEIGAYEKTNIFPVWQQWIEMDLKGGLKLFKRILETDLRSVQIKNPFLVVINRMSLEMTKSIEDKDFDKNGDQFVIKTEKLAKMGLEVESERAMIGRLLSRFFTVFSTSETLPTLAVENLALYYPDPKMLKDRLLTLIHTHEGHIKAIRESANTKEYYKFNRNKFELHAFPAFLKGEAITSADLDSDDSAYKFAALVAQWADEKIAKIDVADAFLSPAQIGFESKYRNLAKTRISEIESLLASPDKALQESQCVGHYIQSFTFSPTLKQVEQVRAQEPSLRARFKQFLAQKFSKNEFDALDKLSASWTADYPISRTEWRERYEQRLKIAYRTQLNSGEDSIDSLETMAALLPHLFDDPYELDVAEYCKTNALNPFPDASIAVNKKFSVGPVTTQLGEKTVGVIFHEMGHLLYAALRENYENRFNKIRNCLISQHPGEGEGRDDEDFADWVAFQLDGKQNFSCVFARYALPEGYASEKLKATDGDPHSSHIFRMLHGEHITSGRTPIVCKQLAKSEKFGMQFKSCKL